MPDYEWQKKMVGRHAAQYVSNGMVIGLGTGSTVRYFAEALGNLVQDGVELRAVATSPQSRRLAEDNAITLLELDGAPRIDICVDGADEVATDLSMIKGGGGALLWEKIVACASARRIYIADSSKLVGRLGRRPLPVEVCQFGHSVVARKLGEHCDDVRLRVQGDHPFVTSSGNYLYDCAFGTIFNARELDALLNNIPGVVETGLFIQMVDVLVSFDGDTISCCESADEVWWN
jgi:ribose 5-phosphate isomerase A